MNTKCAFRQVQLLIGSAFILTVLSNSVASACTKPRKEQISNHKELINRTDRIALAYLEKIEILNTKTSSGQKAKAKSGQADLENSTLYHFKVLRMLKGEVPEGQFTIAGIKSPLENEVTFDNHTDAKFWLTSGGKSGAEKDCQIYPQFKDEGQYLIFIDKPYHRKSFEKINSIEDKWLVTVEELTAKK